MPRDRPSATILCKSLPAIGSFVIPSVIEKSSIPAKFFATLGQPFSLWEHVHGEWEPVDIAEPSHLHVAGLLTALDPRHRGPVVTRLENNELLLCVVLQLEGERLAVTGTFPAASHDSERGWTPVALQRAAALAVNREQLEVRRSELESEVRRMSTNLNSTYKEISVLHGLTRRLRLSNSQRDLSEMALDWLHDCMPAESIFLHYEPSVLASRDLIGKADTSQHATVHLVTGSCQLSLDERRQFCELLTPTAEYIRGHGSIGDVALEGVRQYLAVAIQEREHLGWLVAINHEDNAAFSSTEASLLRSVSTILGIHFANRERFEEQANLVADIVRALTTSIDAKDPYTRGHSDRVAQIAVVLARTLGVEDEVMRTLYIGGLLHDVGKIGVDDTVLRKEGKLTEEEYAQIKLHPELGRQILADLKPLQEVLPIVLHHHERWDGNGYPDGIAGEEIELTARITAVADAYDAMTSDRPYRRGMPQEQVEQVLRDGAGSQWDADVVDAYFTARDEIAKLTWKHEQGPAKWSPQGS